MTVDDDCDIILLSEELSAKGKTMHGIGNSGEELRRIELNLAYCLEKVLNLDTLLIHVESRLCDYEALNVEGDSIPPDAIEKAFEFDALSGILHSELREFDNFMTCLHSEIVDAHQKMLSSERCEVSDVKEKLHDAEESLKQVLEQVAEIRTQSTRFENFLALARKETWNGEGFADNGRTSFTNDKWKMHTVEEQRHVLQVLERSLARELDLEKGLSDSMRNEEELRLKVQLLDRETCIVEEQMESMQAKLFESENAEEVLMVISRDLLSKLQLNQFSLNNSVSRETDTRCKLRESLSKLSCQDNVLQKLETSSSTVDNSLVQEVNSLKASLKESEDRYRLANSEITALRENVKLLEGKLRGTDAELQQAKASLEASEEQQSILQSELTEIEHAIENLRETNANVERRADNAEAKCRLLNETNLELNEELGLTKASALEKEEELERKLRESDDRLDHAKASIEAIGEQQTLLYSALGDMENLIEDLKGKCSKAENRAENAESKCTLLSETNMELNEELGLLRGRIETLEKQFCQADKVKMETARNIGVKSKIITDLVVKLALERERLQVQISTLAKENQTLGGDWWKGDTSIYSSSQEIHEVEKEEFVESFEGSVTESSTTNFHGENQAAAIGVTDIDSTVSAEDVTALTSKVEAVKSIEAKQINLRRVLFSLVLFASIFGAYLFQLEKCPF